MTDVLPIDHPDRDIVWTVVNPVDRGDLTEETWHFATQTEAVEKLTGLISRKSGQEAFYGITVLKDDTFIHWTDETVEVDEPVEV